MASVVLDMMHVPFGGSITDRDLKPYEALLRGGGGGGSAPIVLFRTRNSTLAPTDKFCREFVFLAESGTLAPAQETESERGGSRRKGV